MLHSHVDVSFAAVASYKHSVQDDGRKFANFLARLLAEKRWSKVELERRTGIPRLTIDRHMIQDGSPDVAMRGRYADGLKYPDVDAFDADWLKESPEPNRYLIEFDQRRRTPGVSPATRLQRDKPASAEAFLASHGLAPSDANVDPIPRHVFQLPEWESEVAAGHWIDCITAQLWTDTQGEVVERGSFVIRVRGDSMTPDYQPGDRVLFRIIRLDQESLRAGADYVFQNSDGQCTLKRLAKIGDDAFMLAPLNRRYKPLKLPRQMLARVAIVETVIRPPWEAKGKKR